jgi:hypothetical protein
MKRIVMLCIIVASAAMAYSQSYVGVNVGYAQPITRLNLPVMGKESVLNPTTYNGMKVGVVYDVTLIKGLGVSMGLNYTMGGNATEWKSKSSSIKYPQERSRGWYHQLEIPVDWQYKFQIAKDTWLMLYTGPTLQCGLSLQKKNYVNDGKTVEMNAKNPTDNLYDADDTGVFALKRLNVTWGVGAGFQYERYFLRGGYDFGIINPYKVDSFTGQDIYTRGRFDQWQIKLGMYLWQF